MSAVAGFAPVASSPRAFHRRAGRRPNLPRAAAASREPPSSPPDGNKTTYPEKSNNAVEEVRAWCLRTDGGVLATEADVAALRAAVDRLRDVTDDRTPPLAGTRWRLAGCAQNTLRSPATWLASPFFWIAKEAQHESARLARIPDLFPPWRLAAELSAGGRSGEEWIVAFGARETGAPFPFSVGEAILNSLAVPFRSDAATVEFATFATSGDDAESDEGARGRTAGEGGRDPRGTTSLGMTSRIEVSFGAGRFQLGGDLVTEARLLQPVGARPNLRAGSMDGREGARDAETDANATDAGAGSTPDREEKSRATRLTDDETSQRRPHPPETPSVVGMETREEIETRRACLLTTRFERTGTPLDGAEVPSGAIMGALMSPSPRLRRSFREGAMPSVPYAHVWCDGETMIAEAGSCAETSTLLVYTTEGAAAGECVGPATCEG